jgi:hypothetical protein
LLHISQNSGDGDGSYVVRLVETRDLPKESEIRYAALSYCWGSGTPYKLTKETSQSLTGGVSASLFPRTIRDAVHAVRALEIEWLWVDSMCIVQDDKEDWEREAKTMADVYRGCHLEIAALAASSNEDGLFSMRDPLMYDQCFMFRLDAEDYFVISKEFRRAAEPVEDWPLYKRGWVFQERLLPPRTIKFGPFLSWECREMKVDEFNLVKPILQGGDQWRFEDNLLCGAIHDPSSWERGPPQSDQVYRLWKLVRDQYSELLLTKPMDRLVAIMGLITTIQRFTKWDQVGGLWCPYLPEEILWRRTPTNNSARHTGLRPSWSWVSITGGTWIGTQASEPISEVSAVPGTDDSPNQLLVNSTPVDFAYMEVETPRTMNKFTRAISHGIPSYRVVPEAFPSVRMRYIPDVLADAKMPAGFLPIAMDAGKGDVVGLAIKMSMKVLGAFERLGIAELSFDPGSGDSAESKLVSLIRDPSKREPFVIVSSFAPSFECQ